jgi:hypothetical protein
MSVSWAEATCSDGMVDILSVFLSLFKMNQLLAGNVVLFVFKSNRATSIQIFDRINLIFSSVVLMFGRDDGRPIPAGALPFWSILHKTITFDTILNVSRVDLELKYDNSLF